MEMEKEAAIPKNPAKNFYKHYCFQLGRESPYEARNTLLVVAALIVAVTYQAVVNPPGGVWQDDKRENDAKMVVLTFQGGANPLCGACQQNLTTDKIDATTLNLTIIELEDGNIINKAGKSVLASTNGAAFPIFLLANMLAFSSAAQTILSLVRGCPFQTEMWMAILATYLSYCACVAGVTPLKKIHWTYMFITMALPFGIRLILEFYRRQKK
ncbi:hypothetical protein Tsubulata_003011 [Turnera subulata]|uniref:PGG domain-containing protein n=1 Tax=Turnera subulata TaxID=218843 RepID=A0A9Q0JGG9_9ROSI|nr:hypothetical protein Tsubulata_003011 [Turnera subulata]